MDIDATHLQNLDALSREKWSIACAEVLIQSTDNPTLMAIAAGGRAEFIRVSKPIYEGHAFHYDDYVRMFDRVDRAAQLLLRGKNPGTLAERLKQ
jgi:hypothetical protein